MSVAVRAPQPEPNAPPVQGHCQACGGWIVAGPAGTPWLRGRCANRKSKIHGDQKCPLYGKTQTFTFRS